MSNRSVSISNDTILRTLFILLLVGFVYWVRDVLAIFFVSIILSSAFDPLIDWLQGKKIPRALGILGVYLIFLFVIGGAIYLLIDPIAVQFRDLSRAFPDYYDKVLSGLERLTSSSSVAPDKVSSSLSDLTRSLTAASSSVFGFVTSLFGGIISFFMVLVITFYLTVEENAFKRFIANLMPVSDRPYATQIIGKMQHRMGYWLRGQLILSIIIFVLTYLGLSILGVKYALILALIAGLFEIIPFLGPLLAAVPGVFFAFSQGPGIAVLVAIMYFVVQQLENNLIVPKIMGKTTGLNPLIVILSILVGARVGGVIGALLAVPVATAVAVYFDSVMDRKSKQENKLE